MSAPSLAEILARARQGDREALGTALEKYRPLLRLLAQRQLDTALNARIDASDVVQQTFLEAHRDLATFQGTAEAQFVAWLKQILVHNVASATQTHVVARKRSARREQSMDDSGMFGAVKQSLPADQPSPSSRVMRGEAAVRLAQAMDALPPDQCEAMRLRYLEGMSLAEIAKRLKRSEMAAAGLLKRGLRNMRQRLSSDDTEISNG